MGLITLRHEIDIHVGARLRIRRIEKGFSQTKLADRLGVSCQQLQKYENGANRIGASRLFQVAQILEVPVSYFFRGLDEQLDMSISVPDDLTELEPERMSEVTKLVDSFVRIKSSVTREKIVLFVKSLDDTASP